jgi:type II secretory pathway pseudopilin PulG
VIARLVHRLRSEAGYSLTEILMVLVFLGFISAAFAMVLGSTVRHQGQITEESTSQGELRSAIDRMMREIRTAYSGTTTWPIESTSSSAITFTTPDRASNFHLMRVAYRINAGTLERAFLTSTNTSGTGPPWTWPGTGTPTTWVPLVRHITSATPFNYLDANGAATTTAANVRQVAVSFTFAPAAGLGKSYTYTSSASPRVA